MTSIDPAEVPRALGRLRVALDDSYTRAARELGLTPQQAELLCAAQRPAGITDLSRALRCDRSNVTRLTDRATKRGLLAREVSADDGRARVVRLTEEGEALASRFIRLLESQLAGLVEEWSGDRRREAVRLIHELAAGLERP